MSALVVPGTVRSSVCLNPQPSVGYASDKGASRQVGGVRGRTCGEGSRLRAYPIVSGSVFALVARCTFRGSFST